MSVPRVYVCAHEWGQWEPRNDGSRVLECLRDGCTYTMTSDRGVVTTRYDPLTDQSTRDFTVEQRQAQVDYLRAMFGVPGTSGPQPTHQSA